jgi:hypothetical protein
MIICRCQCGTTSPVAKLQLLRGNSKSCGCRRVHHDLTGKILDGWTVLEYVQEKQRYRCRCECGTVRLVLSREMRTGLSTNCGCRNRLAEGQSALNGVLSTYKITAAKRRVEWNLSNDEFFALARQNCHYCNCEPFQARTHRDIKPVIYMGIDRVDSSKGYVSTNVVPCCKRCNYAKSNQSVETFLDWVKRVYEFTIREDKDGQIKCLSCS